MIRSGLPAGLAKAPCVGGYHGVAVADLHEPVVEADLHGLSGQPAARIASANAAHTGRAVGRTSTLAETQNRE